jgi:hypothetical protein
MKKDTETEQEKTHHEKKNKKETKWLCCQGHEDHRQNESTEQSTHNVIPCKVHDSWSMHTFMWYTQTVFQGT